MLKRISVWFLITAAAALLLSACGGGGNPALDKLFTHYDAMINILKENKSDPDKAFDALNAYQEAHKAELDKLDDELKAFTEKNPLKAAGYLAKFTEKTAELAKLTAEVTAAKLGGK